jgi:two-component system response regulator YesN
MIARILIADDEELERRALRQILSDLDVWDIEIEEAVNGRQAVEAALRSPIDLALLDVRMPGMDGLAAAHELRTIQPGIRLVFVTAFDSFDYAREALRLGVDEYLVKPADPEVVRATVKRALELIRAEREDHERRSRAGDDKKRALSLLEQELRSSFARGTVDAARLDSFLALLGLEDGERLVLVVRRGGIAKRDLSARKVNVRRLGELAERVLRDVGWYVVGGADETEARLAAAAPKSTEIAQSENVRAALSRIVEEALSGMGIRALVGASPYFPEDGPALFTTAQDAASIARPDRPAVLLVPDRVEQESDRGLVEGGGGPIVDRAIAVLRSRLADDLSLTDVASAVSCSPFHLSRLFRQHAGDTFVRVFTRLRIDAAKALLRSGEYSVKEAGSLVGFNDQAYFARVFRKTEGVTPSEFRENGSNAQDHP